MKVQEFPWWTKEQRQLARELEEFSREVAPLVEETDWRAKLGMLDGSLPWDAMYVCKQNRANASLLGVEIGL